MLNVRRSTFDVRRSTFDVRRSTFALYTPPPPRTHPQHLDTPTSTSYYSPPIPTVLTHLHPLHPIFAVAGIAIISLFAAGYYRLFPFYRREMRIESVARLTPLDGLRGILAFAVMYHHSAIWRGFFLTGTWAEPASNFFALLGESSVAFFFCITAFLFWGRALDRKGDIPPFPFLRSRWFRVVPLLFFAGSVCLWIIRKKIHWHRQSTWIALAKMLAGGLYSWGVIPTFDVNMVNAGVTWTLQYEWVFYLALPALALTIKAGYPWYWLFILAAAWVMWGLDQNIDFRAYFITGMLAAHIARMPRTAAVLRSFYFSFPILGILLLMPIYLIIGYCWWASIMTTLIFIPIACGNSVFGLLNFSGLRMMGLVSYSVYLLHGIVLNQSQPLLKWAVHQGTWQYWSTVAALGCCVLMLCSLTYRLIEYPFIQLEKRWR